MVIKQTTIKRFVTECAERLYYNKYILQCSEGCTYADIDMGILWYTAKNMSPDQYSVVYCGAHSYLGLGPFNSIGTLWIRSNIVNPAHYLALNDIFVLSNNRACETNKHAHTRIILPMNRIIMYKTDKVY